MRIPSGIIDQYIYFVGVDSSDLTTRETGLSSFTVYRSRNGAAAAAMTTPTINETDSTNMPGVYELLLDEDMTIGASNDSEEICFHITHVGMAPVTRVIELYQPNVALLVEVKATTDKLDDTLEDNAGTYRFTSAALAEGPGVGGGAGAIEWEIIIQDDGGTPLDGVECWVTTDSAGSNVIAGTLPTDGLGSVTFMLDEGTYYLWRQLNGYNFTNPQTLVVS